MASKGAQADKQVPLTQQLEQRHLNFSQQERIYQYGDYHSRLQKRLYLQWVSRKNCDLILNCSEGCSLPVHSCIVACFSAKLCSNVSDAAKCPAVLDVEFRSDSVIELITFMYTGSLKLCSYNAEEMLKCAEWFGVSVAVTFVREFINAFATHPLRQTDGQNGTAAHEPEQQSSQEERSRSTALLKSSQREAKASAATNPMPSELMDEINSYIKHEIVEVDPASEPNLDVSMGNERISFSSVNLWCESVENESEQQASSETLKRRTSSRRKSDGQAPAVSSKSSARRASSCPSPRKKSRLSSGAVKRARGRKRRNIKQSIGYPKVDMSDNAEGQDTSNADHKDGQTEDSTAEKTTDGTDDKWDSNGKEKISKESFCHLCQCAVESKRELKRHLRHAHGSFQCEECSERFVRKECLTRHVQKYHRTPMDLKCLHCEQSFAVQNKFEQHCREVHNENKPYSCNHQGCSFKTSRVRSLNCHKENVHAIVRNFACEKCGDRFPSKLYLVNHERNCVYTGQHLCSECGAIFNIKQALKHHIRIKHRGEVPYACKVCGRKFNDHRNLGRHMRIHQNLFPYHCEYCGQQFRHSNSLKYHIERVHLPGSGRDAA